MDMKGVKVLIAGEYEVINAAVKSAIDLFGVNCEVANIDDAEEMIFAGNYTHVIVALERDDDREKGVIFYNLLKIRVPAWRKSAKLFKASVSDVDVEDHISLNAGMAGDIAAKIIIN